MILALRAQVELYATTDNANAKIVISECGLSIILANFE
jgi:hypothetical protein